MKNYALVCFTWHNQKGYGSMRHVATVSVADDGAAVAAAYALLNSGDDPYGTVCVVWDLDCDCMICEVHRRA